MTLQELISRIKIVATQNATQPVASPLLDSQVLIEIVLPRVFAVILQAFAKDSDKLASLETTHTVSITNGIGTLPANVPEEYASNMYITEAPTASYKANYFDYKTGVAYCPRFTVQNKKLYFRTEGQDDNDYTGNITLNAVTIPVLPTLIGDTVEIKDNVLEQVIAFTAGLIRGEIPLVQFGLDNTEFGGKKK